MAGAVATVGVSVTAQTAQFTRGMDRAKKGLGRFNRGVGATSIATKGLSTVMGGLGIALGGAAIVGAFVRAAKGAEALNRAMTRSLAIMGNVSDAMRGQMREAALEVARTTTFAAEEAGKAYFFLASAGLSAEQSLAALPLVAKFAEAGNFDLARATDLVTDAQSALGLTVKNTAANMRNMTRVADVLVAANTLANASVEQFSEALTTKAATAMKTLGIEIEEGVAVLAAWADQGIKAADAGTAFNIVTRDLTTKALENRNAFEAAGVAVFDAQNKFRPMADIIEDLENRLSGASDAQKKLTLLQLGFADKSIVFIQSLIGSSQKIREYEERIRSLGGITEEVAEKSLTKLQLAQAKFKGFTEATGSTLVTVYTNALLKVGKAWEALVDVPFFGGGPSLNEFRQQQEDNASIMARIADRAADIEIAEEAAAKARDEDAAATARLNVELEEANANTLRTFIERMDQVKKDTAKLGLSDTELQLRALNEAFDEANAGLAETEFVIPFEVFDEAADAIRELERRQKAMTDATEDANDAWKEQQRIMEDRQSLFEETRNDRERFEAELKRIVDLFDAGPVKGGLGTFDRAMEKLLDQFGRLDNAVNRIGAGREVDLGRTSIAGTRATGRQEVFDPQLKELITVARAQLAAQKKGPALALTN